MTQRPVIFSTHKLHPDIAAQLEELGALRIAREPTRTAILEESRGATYIVVRAPIPPQIAEREDGLRAMVRHGAGLDMIPVDICTRQGILVANVPGVNAVTVAEHVIWTALALLRKNPLVRHDFLQSGWEAGRQHSNDGRELTGKVLGIVGMGNVGQALHRIASQGLSMEVLATTRTFDDLPEGVEVLDIEALFARADVIALCCPLTDETRGMVNAGLLSRVKKGAILINVARGPIVVEKDLVSALRSGPLGGAALDVFKDQPLPNDHPFASMTNVIITPHMAGITSESMLRMGQGVVDEITRMEKGVQPDNFCNPVAWKAYRVRFAGD